MTPHHGHVYRTHKEADRIISDFGRRPLPEVRESIRETLYKEKERFLALERIRHRQQQRSGRSIGRER